MATTGFYPAVSWGGPVKIVHQNALELQRRGHHVTVVATNLLDKNHRIADGSFQRTVDGLDVHYLQTYSVPGWPGTLGPTMLSLNAARRMRRIVQSVDVVHVNATRNAISVQAMQKAHALGKPLVVQPHGTLPYIVNSKRLKKAYDRLFLDRLLRHVDAFIAGQPAEVQQILAAGARPEQVQIIPNGLNKPEDELEALHGRFRQKHAISSEKSIVLFLARINRKKGTDLLVEAFARLPEDIRSRTQLVIAGPNDGQLKEVQDLIEQHGLGQQVLLPGLLTGEDTWSALVDATVFVLPCRVDTFPMAIIEACRAGKPMVITETCEIAGLLDDKVARICTVDAGAIAKSLAEVLNDSDLQQRFAAGADALMKTTFSLGAVGDSLETLYQQVINQKQSHAVHGRL